MLKERKEMSVFSNRMLHVFAGFVFLLWLLLLGYGVSSTAACQWSGSWVGVWQFEGEEQQTMRFSLTQQGNTVTIVNLDKNEAASVELSGETLTFSATHGLPFTSELLTVTMTWTMESDCQTISGFIEFKTSSKSANTSFAAHRTGQTPPPVATGAPRIVSIDIPGTLVINIATDWNIVFEDPEGDIMLVRFEGQSSGEWQASGEGDPKVQGQTQGSIIVQTTCKQLGSTTKRVTLIDAQGNSSKPMEYTYDCVNNASDVPDKPISVSQALDSNRNGLLDDGEITKAIQYWIQGQEVPGSGETISDATIQQLVQMWIMGTSVNSSMAKASSTSPTNLHLVRLNATNPLVRVIQAQSGQIESIQVELFDLSGKLLIHEQAVGSQLTFLLRMNSGRTLANGTYLYVLTTRGVNGSYQRHQVKKLILLR